MIGDLLFSLGGISLAIIGYFLKKTLDELEKVKAISYDNKTKLSLIELDYVNKVNGLNDKFEDLKEVMKALTIEIKVLSNKMK